MATLKNFIYCLDVERIPNASGKGDSINAKGVLTVMIPEFIPGTFSFSVIFSILGIDSAMSNQVKIIFKDPVGKELINTNNIAIPTVPTDAGIQLPTEYVGYNLSMDFRNVILENAGEYVTEIYFNDELIGANPIYVKGRR